MAHPKEETMSPPPPLYQGDGPNKGLFDKIKGLLPFHMWLMLPTIIVLAVITIYPFIWMVVMSFKETAMDPGETDIWVGLYNYVRLLDDEPFLNGVKLLVWYFILCLSIEMIVGTSVAMLINNAKFENVFLVIFVMPMMVAPIVVGYLFRFLYNVSFGWGYWFLKSTGLMGGETILANAKPWLLPFMPSTAFMAVVAADVWEWTPLIILIVLAGLKAVPQDQLEAARVDGAGPVRTFLEVTLPNIKGVLLIAVVVRFMDNVRLIDLIYVLTKGGPADTTKILPFYLYNVSFRYFEFGRGAAIGFILLLFTIIMGLFFVNVVFKKKEVGNNG
jgi:multiple sugar transport system permease protein